MSGAFVGTVPAEIRHSGGAVPAPITTTRGEERQCAATRAAATGAPVLDR
jgi:hypothetical protein